MKTDDTRMKHAPFWTVFFSLLSLVWIFPVVLVLINSFKQKSVYFAKSISDSFRQILCRNRKLYTRYRTH